MDVLQVARRTIQRYGLVRPGETVVVGVSGGPDSLCLLHVLRELAAELAVSLHVAHLHHGLRGPEADADAAFVQQLAAEWGLPCTVEQADVPALARQPGISVEEAARQLRYRFLGQLAQRLGSRTIAVGHTADDQAETVLMHWLRGSGLAGLRGMTPMTRLADYRLGEQPSEIADERTISYEVRLIRPLLFVSRADVLRYCEQHGLRPRFDRSNEDTTYFRNRLRHELLPLLEEYNPQIRRVLQHTATVLADDYDLLRRYLLEAWPDVVLKETAQQLIFDLARWRELPISLQRGVLREAISRLRRSLRDVSFIHVENALWALREGTTGTRMTLPAGMEVVLSYDRFAIGEAGLEVPEDDVPWLDREPLPVAVPGTTELGHDGWQITASLVKVADLPSGWRQNRDPWQAWLDADVVGPRPHLRTRQAGDRFQPLGLGGRDKLLAEFFVNEKVPAAARDRWPLLVTTTGDIAWVCGLRVDERARVTDRTRQVLYLRLSHSPFADSQPHVNGNPDFRT